MFLVRIGYPSRAEEVEILKRTTGDATARLLGAHVQCAKRARSQLQDLVRQVPVADQVYERTVELVHATRPGGDRSREVPDATGWLRWGAGPRAGQMLILGGKARALLHGRFHVSTDDICALAHPVLRHRLVTSFAAQAQGLGADVIIDRLVTHFGS